MSALNPAKELKALLRVVLLVVASPLCFAIDLVSTNSLGMQGPLTDEPRASAISNDGNSVLFVSSDPTLVPGERGNFYVKTMSRNSIVQLARRTDGLPLESGFPNIYAVMDEPPTRVLFATNEGNLGPGIGASGPKILATTIGSFQYLAARGIMGGPAMQFADFAVNSRLDRIYLQTLEPLPVVSSGYQLAEVSATLATAPIVHTLRTDGLVSQVAGSAPNFANLPSISASADGRIVSWGGMQFDLDPIGNDGLVTGQIFIRDTQLGVTPQVRADDGQNMHFAIMPRVSDDGSYVVFNADSYFVAAGGCNDYSIYGIDTRTWQRECISVNDSGQSANANSWRLDVSGDGSRVVFENRGRNLGPVDPSPSAQ